MLRRLAWLATHVQRDDRYFGQRQVPVNAIKELAGHQDIMTTMRYMHLSPAAKDTAVQALDNRDAALKRQLDAAAPAENA